MPIDHYNPVLNGIQAAQDIASRIRAAAMQQQQMKRLEEQDKAQAEERTYQREQRLYDRGRQQSADALTEANLRMKMTDAGIHQATPTDLAESTAQRFSIDGDQLVPTGQVGTSIVNRMFDYGGKKMVMPSEEQQQSDANYQAKIAEGIAASKAGAEARARFDATATAMPSELSAKLGLPAGIKVGPTVQDDVIRAMLQLANPPAENWQTQATDQGIVQVSPRTGATRPVKDAAGKPLTRTPRTASGELTAYQKAQEANRDEARMNADIEKHDKLMTEADTLHAFRVQAGDAMNVPDGKLFVEPKTGRDTVMSRVWRSRLKTQITEADQKLKALESRTKGIRQKYSFGEFAPGAAPQPAAQPRAAAAVVPSNQAQVGSTVTLKDGSVVVIKSIDTKTGKFTY